MSQISVEELTSKLRTFVADEQNVIKPPPSLAPALWKSGVYSVLDCVFSSQADYEEVVLPTLKRFGDNSGLHDESTLRFSDFLGRIRGEESGYPSEDRFEECALKLFRNSQEISGRTKVQVAYDVCQAFASQGWETRQDLTALPKGCSPEEPGQLEVFIMDGMAYGQPQDRKIRGIGLALGAYLLILLGDESYVKPDTLLLRLMGNIGGWQPRGSNTNDFLLIRKAITNVANDLGVTPASLDNALWKYASEAAKRSERFVWTSLEQITIIPPIRTEAEN